MSRAKAAADRLPLDAYWTPQGLADAICLRLSRTLGYYPRSVLEPSAGTGAFVRAARRAWLDAHVTACELDEQHRGTLQGVAGAHVVLIGDWVETARQLANQQDETRSHQRLILGNPPYRLAREHIEAAHELMLPGDHLALLLRLNFLGSTDRVSLWRRPGLLTVAAIAPRPSFTGGGTDGTEYALFVWRQGYQGAPRLQRPIVWEPPKRGRG